MEQLLSVYKRPYNPAFPVVCMDESPKQLISHKTVPLPTVPGHAQRYDYEYRRHGCCNIFIACEPLVGYRLIKVSEHKTKRDWAWFLRDIAAHYPRAEKIALVMDNYCTHDGGSFYETFQPAEAKRLHDRFEFIYTPLHGSWLNMAEIELSVLTNQCLQRRIGTIEEVEREVNNWQQQRNNKNATINWQFTTDDARIKLRRLYPTINV